MRTLSKLATATLLLALAGTGLATSASADDFDDSCDGMTQPQVTTHPGNAAPTPVDDSAEAVAGSTTLVKVLANDADPENDKLYVTGTSTPTRGEVCVESDGDLEYTAAPSAQDYTASFTYGVTDGDLYRSATVTVAVTGLSPVRAVLRHRLGHGGPARLAFTNTNSLPVIVLGGKPNADRSAFRRRIEPGRTVVVRTRITRLEYYVFVAPLEDFDVDNAAVINTRTGRQHGEDVSFLASAGRVAHRWLGR